MTEATKRAVGTLNAWQHVHADSAEWGAWESVGPDDESEQRYIDRIVVCGDTYTFDGATAICPDGRRLKNVGRGEMRGPDGKTWVVYALDGIAVQTTADAETDCARAIICALQD